MGRDTTETATTVPTTWDLSEMVAPPITHESQRMRYGIGSVWKRLKDNNNSLQGWQSDEEQWRIE